jgi:hypothetical protein
MIMDLRAPSPGRSSARFASLHLQYRTRIGGHPAEGWSKAVRLVPMLLAAGLVVAQGSAARERGCPPIHVIPAPKQASFEGGVFEIDEYAAVLVSGRAARRTRHAARLVQLGLRERFGIDPPILRIRERMKHGPRKAIWVVEPGLLRPPANTIGVKGLKFTDEMMREGYFLRVDPIEIVIHGASDAGSHHGAQTLLQLIRPPRKATLFRKARGPTIPCLWLRDWPSSSQRIVPSEIPVPPDPAAAERFLEAAARYKLNAVSKKALPGNEAARERLRELAERRPIQFVDEMATLGASPLARLAAQFVQVGDAARSLAAYAEEAWGPPDPEPEVLRLRLGLPAPE